MVGIVSLTISYEGMTLHDLGLVQIGFGDCCKLVQVYIQFDIRSRLDKWLSLLFFALECCRCSPLLMFHAILFIVFLRVQTYETMKVTPKDKISFALLRPISFLFVLASPVKY